ncbi:MAG: hypothetical protein QOJ99_6208 [Bryobacterales bacterium]|nr:hypothetical protein [Bryobacterales bacterium]
MAFWSWFWTVNFIIAGSAFAAIALVVAFKGVADLRTMLADLKAAQVLRQQDRQHDRKHDRHNR